MRSEKKRKRNDAITPSRVSERMRPHSPSADAQRLPRGRRREADHRRVEAVEERRGRQQQEQEPQVGGDPLDFERGDRRAWGSASGSRSRGGLHPRSLPRHRKRLTRPRAFGQHGRQMAIEGARAAVPEASAAPRPALLSDGYRRYALGAPAGRVRAQLRGPADPLDPRRGHPQGDRAHRHGAGPPGGDRVRALLHVRGHPDRALGRHRIATHDHRAGRVRAGAG